MKKVFVLLLVSILAVTMFVSCNSSPNSENSGSGSGDSGSGSNTPTVVPVEFSSLEGKWRATENSYYYLAFEKPDVAKTLTYNSSTSSSTVTGTYTVSISGDVVTFTANGTSYSYKCTVSGNSLTLVHEDDSLAISEISDESWQKI